MHISLLLPEITLFCGALIILLSDVFLNKKFKEIFYASHLLALVFCALSLFFLFKNFTASELLFNQMFATSSIISFCKAIAVLLLTITILLSLGFIFSMQKTSAEFLALLMIATVGGMVLLSANDFITFYLGLELQALSLYLLAAFKHSSAKSSEAGMKYFILGAVASGLLLFGISLIYGFSGNTNFSTLSELYQNSGKNGGEITVPVAVMFGFLLVLTAMLFKTAAAPFHMWSPDVYEGSPTIVTTFFATVVKFITAVVFVRIFYNLILGWPGITKIFIFTAILSLAVGSFGAIFQKNIKRLLAYSSIGHIGFVLLGMAAFSKNAMVSCLIYLVIYSVISLGSFGFLNLIFSKDDKKFGEEDDQENAKIFDISALSGLAKTNPTMAFSLAVLMFSSAGIPPLAGFFSKFYIISSALSSGLIFSSIAAILFSVVSAFYYLRIVKVMYFDEPTNAMVLEDFGNVKLVVLLTAIFNIALIFFLDSLVNTLTNFATF